MSRYFNGSSDYLNSASNINLGSWNKITVSFWLEWDAFANDNKVALEFSPDASSNTGAFNVVPDNTSTSAFLIGLDGSAGTYKTSTYITRPNALQYNHVCIALDRTAGSATTSIKTYLNGNLQSSTSNTYTSLSGNFGNFPLYLMTRAATGLWGAGSLGNLAIHAGILTSGQIMNLAMGASPTSLGTCLHYWPITGVSSPEADSPGNMLVNGSFESGLSSWTSTLAGTSTVTVNRTNQYSGLSCAQFYIDGTGDVAQLTQIVTLSMNTAYTLNFAVASTSAVYFAAQIIDTSTGYYWTGSSWSSSYAELTTAPGDSNYHYLSYNFTTPVTGTTTSIILKRSSGYSACWNSYFYVDSASVYATTNLTVHGTVQGKTGGLAAGYVGDGSANLTFRNQMPNIPGLGLIQPFMVSSPYSPADVLYLGQNVDRTFGNPSPSLQMRLGGRWGFWWSTLGGVANTIQVDANYLGYSAGYYPQIIVHRNSSLGLLTDTTVMGTSASGWQTLGPATVTPTTSGLLYVELYAPNLANSIGPGLLCGAQQCICHWDNLNTNGQNYDFSTTNYSGPLGAPIITIGKNNGISGGGGGAHIIGG